MTVPEYFGLAIFSILLSILNFYCFSRVIWEFICNEDTKQIPCLLHFPLLFATFLFNFGFGIQNILFTFVYDSCTDFPIKFFTHIGLIGLYGWLPSIVAGLFIPSLALYRTANEDLDSELTNYDMFIIWDVAAFVSIVSYVIAISTNSFQLTEYTFYCSLSPVQLTTTISVQLVVSISLAVSLWYFGMKKYFSQVFAKKDTISASELAMGRRTLLYSSSFDEAEMVECASEPIYDWFSDSLETVRTSRNLTDYHLQQIKFSASIIMAFDGHFRSTWFYILTIVIGVVLSYTINNEEFSNICFLICKTCGIQACYLFFNSKVLMEGQRWLFPCKRFCCFKHRSREEVDEYIGERLRMMTVRMSAQEHVDTWDIPKSPRKYSSEQESIEMPSCHFSTEKLKGNFFTEDLKGGGEEDSLEINISEPSENIPEMEMGGVELKAAEAEHSYEFRIPEDFDMEIDEFAEKRINIRIITKPSSPQNSHSWESVDIEMPSDTESLDNNQENLKHAMIGEPSHTDACQCILQ